MVTERDGWCTAVVTGVPQRILNQEPSTLSAKAFFLFCFLVASLLLVWKSFFCSLLLFVFMVNHTYLLR
jgi:hypothetical protein